MIISKQTLRLILRYMYHLNVLNRPTEVHAFDLPYMLVTRDISLEVNCARK